MIFLSIPQVLAIINPRLNPGGYEQISHMGLKKYNCHMFLWYLVVNELDANSHNI